MRSLNNLLSCEAAVPSDAPAKWDEREEVQDLFSVYASKVCTTSSCASNNRICGGVHVLSNAFAKSDEREEVRDDVSAFHYCN